MQEENDILERLKHPEREPERRKMTRNLFIRNVLNSVFILMALVAMVGLLVVKQQPKQWASVLLNTDCWPLSSALPLQHLPVSCI